MFALVTGVQTCALPISLFRAFVSFLSCVSCPFCACPSCVCVSSPSSSASCPCLDPIQNQRKNLTHCPLLGDYACGRRRNSRCLRRRPNPQFATCEICPLYASCITSEKIGRAHV